LLSTADGDGAIGCHDLDRPQQPVVHEARLARLPHVTSFSPAASGPRHAGDTAMTRPNATLVASSTTMDSGGAGRRVL
jgi:hypothetical protein